MARTLLDQPDEGIVVIYLDHAGEALRIVSEQSSGDGERSSAQAVLSAAAMASAEDLGLPEHEPARPAAR